jgi:enoyl-CoA hydratase/carnithine racemase
MTQEILLDQRDGIALVTIDRPQVRNALTIAMCRELISLFEQLATDTDARVIVLRGRGGHFCSGPICAMPRSRCRPTQRLAA